MANKSSGGTQAGDEPANASLFTEVKSYLLKVKGIGNAEALSFLNRAEQTMKALKTRVVMKNEKINASQMMNKMAETIQKISQKMDKLKKKNSIFMNSMKKSFVEMAHNFKTTSAFASQKTNELKQTLNIKMTTIRINSDVDKKMLAEKSTRDLMNQIIINCQKQGGRRCLKTASDFHVFTK